MEKIDLIGFQKNKKPCTKPKFELSNVSAGVTGVQLEIEKALTESQLDIFQTISPKFYNKILTNIKTRKNPFLNISIKDSREFVEKNTKKVTEIAKNKKYRLSAEKINYIEKNVTKNIRQKIYDFLSLEKNHQTYLKHLKIIFENIYHQKDPFYGLEIL